MSYSNPSSSLQPSCFCKEQSLERAAFSFLGANFSPAHRANSRLIRSPLAVVSSMTKPARSNPPAPATASNTPACPLARARFPRPLSVRGFHRARPCSPAETTAPQRASHHRTFLPNAAFSKGLPFPKVLHKEPSPGGSFEWRGGGWCRIPVYVASAPCASTKVSEGSGILTGSASRGIFPR